MPDSPCLSPYAIEKALAADGWPSSLSAGELAHLRTCPHCAQRLAAARATEQEFQDAVAPATLQHVVEQAPVRATSTRFPAWQWGLVAAGLAAAVIAALVLVLPAVINDTQGPPAATDKGYVGLRGAASLDLFVKRGDEVLRFIPGAELHPGDRVRVVPVPAGRTQLLLLLRDAVGKIQVVYPWDGKRSGAMPPAGQALDGSFELDQATGEEAIVGFLSDAHVDAPWAVEYVRTGWDRGQLRPPFPVAHVDVVVVRYQKVMP